MSRSAAGRRRLQPPGKPIPPAPLHAVPASSTHLEPPMAQLRGGSLDSSAPFVFPSPSRSNARPPPSSPPLGSSSLSTLSSPSPTSLTFPYVPNRPASLNGSTSEFVYPSSRSRAHPKGALPPPGARFKFKRKKTGRSRNGVDKGVPSSDATLASEESALTDSSSMKSTQLKRFPRFTLNRSKKKKKKGEDDASAPSISPVPPKSSGSDEIERNVEESVADPKGDNQVDSPQTYPFVEKNTWLKRHGMRLHPYQADAPYMQAYNPEILDNDRHTDVLLRRLCAPGSVTFHDYGGKPPATVLDLGCGQGHWILDAAATWKDFGTKITGFDLVDITKDTWSWEDDEDVTKNIRLVRGNFLKYPLPFPDNSFELVRMANLTLCIPYDSWDFVLSEARRVLTIGGRLELIDDQIVFPYGQAPYEIQSRRPLSVTPSIISLAPRINIPIPSASFVIEEENEEQEEEEGGSYDLDDLIEEYAGDDFEDLETATTLTSDGDDGDSASEYGEEPGNLKPLIQSFPLPMQPSQPLTPWEYNVTASEELETVFESMLSQKYAIHPRPADFILDLMKRVFGAPHANKARTLPLKLAPPDAHLYFEPPPTLNDSPEPDQKNSTRGQRIYSRSSFISSKSSDTALPETNFWRLTYSAMASTSPISQSSASSSHSLALSPGLILAPSIFIPIPPSELESHACKHMRIVLGCRAAIAEFVDGTDDNGVKFVEEDEFQEALADYECFFQQRFNFGSSPPQTDTSSLSTTRSKSRPRSIRSIRSVNYRNSYISNYEMSEEFREAMSEYQSEFSQFFSDGRTSQTDATTINEAVETPKGSTFRSAAGLNHNIFEHPQDSSASIMSTDDDYDGSDLLTHLRTIRVFEAVKAADSF